MVGHPVSTCLHDRCMIVACRMNVNFNLAAVYMYTHVYMVMAGMILGVYCVQRLAWSVIQFPPVCVS